MTKGRAFENRRQEARHHLPSIPVAWTRAGAGRWRRGWLNDVSLSGAALLVPMENAPKAGQDIEVRRRRDGEAMLCRVVRTQVRGDDRDLVACRVVCADGHLVRLGPVPRALEARRKMVRRPSIWRSPQPQFPYAEYRRSA